MLLTPDELRALIREEIGPAIADLAEQAREPDGLITSEQLARRLKVSNRTIYTLRQRGMPTIMLGDSHATTGPTWSSGSRGKPWQNENARQAAT